LPPIQFIEIRNSNFSCFIDTFTANTFICIVINDCEVPSPIIKANIAKAKPVFERLEKESMMIGSNGSSGATNGTSQIRHGR
jgi:hypothetical protein